MISEVNQKIYITFTIRKFNVIVITLFDLISNYIFQRKYQNFIYFKSVAVLNISSMVLSDVAAEL